MKKLTIYLFVLCLTFPVDARLANFKANQENVSEIATFRKKKKRKAGKRMKPAKRPTKQF